MPPDGDRGDPSYPMLQVFKDIGSIKKGIENLEGGQGELDQKVSGLHRTVADLVTKEDCKDHRDVFCKKVDAKLEVVAVAVAEEPTGAKNGLLERMGKKAGALMAILALLGVVGGGLLVLSRFIGSVERTLAADRKEQKQVTAKMLKQLAKPQEPVVVREKVYVYPDAGPRRRPRRRPRRTLPAKRSPR